MRSLSSSLSPLSQGLPFLMLCLIFVASESFAEDEVKQVVEANAETAEQAARLPEPFYSMVLREDWNLKIVETLPESFRFDVGVEPPIQGNKLHALESSWSHLGRFDLSFHLLSWDEDDDLIEYRGELERIYPGKIEGFEKPQLWREKISFFVGARTDSLRWLTIRPVGSAPDGVWSYSPHLKRTRRINAENREDRVFSSALSLEDLVFFSRKAEGLHLVEETESRHLLPFVVDRKVVSEGKGECFSVNPASLRTAGHLDYGPVDNQERRVARWLSQQSFVPRKVTVLVFESNNPYREIAHEILVIDTEFWLPAYRLSYDVLGRLRFSSFQVYGLAELERERAPALVSSLVFDHEMNRLSVLKVQKQNWCSATKEDLSAFQPQQLVQAKKSAPPRVGAVPEEGRVPEQAPPEEGSPEDLFSPEI